MNNSSHTYSGPLRSKKLRKKMILDQIKNDSNGERKLTIHPQLLIKYVENDDIEHACEICTDIWMVGKIKMLKINNIKECYKCRGIK